MPHGLVAVVLAAGAGTRLRPLTHLRPKALCPVDNVPMLDLALGRVTPHTDEVAVNVWHLREQIEAHLDGRDVHVSVEEPEALETAGALGLLRPWIDGRDVLVCNSDVYHPQGLDVLVDGWDRKQPRLLVVRDPQRPDFDDLRYTGAALLPWDDVKDLPAERHGLYGAVLGPAWEAGRLEFVRSDVTFHDCGTPADYLAANLEASGGASVVAPNADIGGEVIRSVVWPGAHVHAGERLVDAIRASDDVTVQVG